MRALIVGNRGDSDLGFVGVRLTELGFEILSNEREYPRGWCSLANIDLVLLLGSDWSVYWDHYRKEVAAESDLVRTAVRCGVPILGICYGAQLISHALGGNVWRSPEPEIGWSDVVSPALTDLLQRSWFQWHYDVFSAPEGMKPVASNEIGIQAMRGRGVFATQFHPEADLPIISRWSSGDGQLELAKSGIDLANLIEYSRARCAEASVAACRLVDWFLEFANTSERNLIQDNRYEIKSC